MSEPKQQSSKTTNKVETCNRRAPLKAKTIQRLEEIRKLKAILKTRPHPELQEQRLLLAVSTNNTERVQSLLETGVSPNATDRQLRSALHLATSRGYVEVVRLLLDFGAEPNKLDIIHNTPLHLAACLHNFQIIKMLLDAGADVRSLDVYGRNPLQLAESKLRLLKRSWKEGAIEMIQLRSQIQQIVDMMISMWKHKGDGTWGHHRDNVDDLELMKLNLNSDPSEEVDDQLDKLLTELHSFSMK